jgi:type I restriction enzyme R subunit
MNEAETRAELIDPALKAAGWGVVEGSRVRREVITKGRLLGGGHKAKQDIADYVLTHRGQKLAVVEAKRRGLPDTEGVGQAKRYAGKLQARFAYSTNGKGIYQIDMETGKEGYVESYPSPEMLWAACFAEENEWRDRFEAVPIATKSGTWEARYYQHNAINRTLETIAAGGERILLTLATGTGKTAIAFQLAWKLFQSRWTLARDGVRRPRILFLADRNILADQAFNSFNSFAAFEEKALVRIAPDEIRKNGRVPKNGSVFFTIFQTFMSGSDAEGEPAPYFGAYPPDFFDFIVIDECHRGGSNDESSWRGILEYFSPAVQLGLTATPKRDKNIDTYEYFGRPVYSYSLKEGINDGFLTPFRVKQISTTLDDYVYTSDDEVLEGQVEAGRLYKEDDFNQVIEIEARERYRVRQFMESIDQRQKTLVFCATQAHALAVRNLVNQLKTSRNTNYCVRVTAFDGAAGDTFLKTFQDDEKTIPTILTTSRKLSTGVDAKNVRNIVLMRPVKSIIEFKQIIGRGTRLFEGKEHFTVYDFVKAYEHFSDPEWDGEPLDPEPAKPREPRTGPDEPPIIEDPPLPPQPPQEPVKIRLADGKIRAIQSMTSTSFWDPEGRPISVVEFIESLYGVLPGLFKDESELRRIWGRPDTRQKLLEGLKEKGYGQEQLDVVAQLINAEHSDLYDVLAYIAFALAPISREARVAARKGLILSRYQDKQQEFLDFVLKHYIRDGVDELSLDKLPRLVELKYQNANDGVAELGSARGIRELFVGFQEHLYAGEGVGAEVGVEVEAGVA